MRFELAVATTEEINFVGYTAAMLAECDKDLDAELQGKTPIKVSASSSIRECKREYAREAWPEMSRYVMCICNSLKTF
jgi:ATP-dependent protease HslVU (ClpYQ) ATPase subunit